MREAVLLRAGKVGVIPTDTLYALAAVAMHEAAVQRVYLLKKRTPSKPCIILIDALDALSTFDVVISVTQREVLARVWPGEVSVVLACGTTAPEYLHRGTGTLAFRLPANQELRNLIRESGPLIAPSANPESFSPATTIEEAKNYFHENVDFYKDGGTRAGMPSTLIMLGVDGKISVLRKGRAAHSGLYRK